MCDNKVVLRVIESKDLEKIYAWKNDFKLLGDVLGKIRPTSLDEVNEWYVRNQKDPNQELFGIYVKSELIGVARLMFIDWINRNTELGIYIGDKSYHGKGLGSDSVRQLVNHAFNNLNLHKVYLTVNVENKSAIKTYLNNGFTQEAILNDVHYLNGAYVNVAYMSILNE